MKRMAFLIFLTIIFFLNVASSQQCNPCQGPNCGGPDPGPTPCHGGCGGGGGGNGGGTGGSIPVVRPSDPNEIIGTNGYDTTIKWISIKDNLPYKILFENDPDFATAPAQKVVIYLPIPANLNPNSLRIGDFGFGSFNQTVTPAPNYTKQLDLRDSLGLLVNVTAGIDLTNRRAFWVFQSIDPATGLSNTLPPNSGFLPVNDSLTGSGEGYVTLTIQPVSTAHTRDTVSATASIIFDINEAIPTNRWKNTIDALPPTSKINIASHLVDTVFTVNWTAADDNLGSGIRDYALYYSKNNGPFTLYQDHIDSASIVFSGEKGATYFLYTIATDNTGNKEVKTKGDDTVVVATFVRAGSDTTASVCDAFTWRGMTYTVSGVYTSTGTINGTAVTDTLHLTIRYSTFSDDTVRACTSYTWNGTTFTQSGQYSYHTLNSVNCDSTAVLHLAIDPIRTYYRDADSDGFGNPADTIHACTKPAGYVTDSTDCNDSIHAVHTTQYKPSAVVSAVGPTTICSGFVQLFASNQADSTSPGDKYKWFRNGFVLNGDTSNTLKVNLWGQYSVAITSVDGCSNVSPGFAVVTDTIPPKAPVLADIRGACTVTAPTPSATDNCVGTVTGTTTDPVTYTTPGTYVITWKFNDGNGNISTAFQKVIIVSQLSNFSAPDVRVNADSFKCQRTNFTVPSPVANFSCQVQSTVSNHPSTTYPVGTTLVTWTVTDSSSHVFTVKQRVIVTPVADTFRANAAPNSCEANNVNIGSPFSSADCSNYTVTNNHPSTIYPIGVTLVTWKLVNNTNTEISYAYQYVSISPVLSNLQFNADTGSCSASNITLPPPFTAGTCTAIMASNNHPSTTYAIGINEVTWTFVVNGKPVYAKQYVYVVPGALPVVRVNTDSNSCNATVNLGMPFAGNLCNAFTISNDHSSPTYPLGLTTVSWTFKYANGKVAFVIKQYVVVKDIQKPVLVPPAAQTLCFSASGNTIPPVTASDNCAISSLTYKIEGATQRIGTGADASGNFNQGTSWVYWRASDAAGNAQQVSTKVLVKTCTPIAKAAVTKTLRVIIDTSSKSSSIEAYPNPTAGEITLALNNFAPCKAEISVVNETGQEVAMRSIEIKRGKEKTNLDLSAKIGGVYFIKVKCASELQMIKIVLQKDTVKKGL